jgi:hypothetical protein
MNKRVRASVMPRALRWVRCTVQDWPSNAKPNISLEGAHCALPASNFFKDMGSLLPPWPEWSGGGNKPWIVLCNRARPVRWRAEPSGLLTGARMYSSTYTADICYGLSATGELWWRTTTSGDMNESNACGGNPMPPSMSVCIMSRPVSMAAQK